MRLLSLGDSHAMYTFAGVAEAKLYWIGPVTMHRAARDGIRSLVPDFLKLTAEDTIIFCFGEIDCRAHIRKQVTRNNSDSMAEVDLLTSRYAQALAAFQKTTKAKLALSCVPPFVVEHLEHELYETRDECQADAKRIRERMNQNLSDLGYSFVDYYADVVQPDGAFKPEFTDGICHLDSRRSRPVIKALERLFPVKFTHRDPPWPHPRALVERAPPEPRMRTIGRDVERFLKVSFLKVPGAARFRQLLKSKLSR